MTENSFPSGTLTAQGVRQVPPTESRASAPGGLDSIDSDAVVGLDEKKSMLGIANEHAARPRPPATTPMARLIVMFVLCRSPVPFNRSNPKQASSDASFRSAVPPAAPTGWRHLIKH